MTFEHVESTMEYGPDGCRGQTVWRAPNGAGLGWEWIEVERGVIALADPMGGIVTNLCVVDENTRPVGDSRRALVLNALVHGVKWQGAVRRAVRDQLRAVPA